MTFVGHALELNVPKMMSHTEELDPSSLRRSESQRDSVKCSENLSTIASARTSTVTKMKARSTIEVFQHKAWRQVGRPLGIAIDIAVNCGTEYNWV